MGYYVLYILYIYKHKVRANELAWGVKEKKGEKKKKKKKT